MTLEDIERCEEQAKSLGYLKFVHKNNIFYHNGFGNSWTVEVTITSSRPNVYLVEAALLGTNTRYTKDFVTGHEDIIGPAHQWCKSLIAFYKLIE